jgi:glyoxylase-like metal-dependent hydrolase (beta-lactamase superfamily II)
MIACPTGTIGTVARIAPERQPGRFSAAGCAQTVLLRIQFTQVLRWKQLLRRASGGNWLIDSPRFTHHLINRFDEAGGIQYLFLTHRDDVADAEQFAPHFGSQRNIHRCELGSQPRAEIVLDGCEAVSITPDFPVIPTPGHTCGHCCLLDRGEYLFTGDHLDWDRSHHGLDASEKYCWHSWELQKKSLAKLLAYSFEWIFPGHGQRIRLERQVMQQELRTLVDGKAWLRGCSFVSVVVKSSLGGRL